MPILGNVSFRLDTFRSEPILITEKLKQYLTNPIVNIQVLNFKISVLGDVKRPGSV